MERDGEEVKVRFVKGISTHTLTWSVTSGFFSAETLKIISTHTLTWSVTFLVIPAFFQLAISTHTLTWSVTKGNSLDVSGLKHFNSHAHVERDIWKSKIIICHYLFQLTRSRGA